MASNNGRGRTPEQVAKAATSSRVLNSGGLSLLGVFGADGAMQALVRHPGGRVQKIKTGSRFGFGKVIAIDKDGLMVAQNGQARRIAMPGG